MIDLARRLRPYGLLAAAVVLVVAAVRYVDLDTVEWILRGAPSVKAERPSGSITVQGTDFSLDSFRQLLSRDGITPIYDPKFVSAAKASGQLNLRSLAERSLLALAGMLGNGCHKGAGYPK